MAFDGRLFEVLSTIYGGYKVTGEKYIDYEKYKVTRNIQDLDSYRDGNGELHRTALSRVPIKIELETRPGLSNKDMEEFFGNIRKRFTVPKERKCSITYYDPEYDKYRQAENCYMPDPAFEIRNIEYDKEKNTYKIFYKSVRFAFIGYGDKDNAED